MFSRLGLVLSFFFFFLMIRRPPRSTLFPTRRSSDFGQQRAEAALGGEHREHASPVRDRKSTRLNSSHANISYAVFCLKKKKSIKEQKEKNKTKTKPKNTIYYKQKS